MSTYSHNTLIDAVRNTAESDPDQVLITSPLDNHDNDDARDEANEDQSTTSLQERQYSYGSLWEEANTIAYRLCKTLKLKRGDRVVIYYESGVKFFASFLGCMRAEVTAILINSPPSSKPLSHILPKISKAINDYDAKLVIVDSKLHMLRMRDRSKMTSSTRLSWPTKVKYAVHENLVQKRNQEEEIEMITYSATNDYTTTTTSPPGSDLVFIQPDEATGTMNKVSHESFNSSNIKSILSSILQPYNIDFKLSWTPSKPQDNNDTLSKRKHIFTIKDENTTRTTTSVATIKSVETSSLRGILNTFFVLGIQQSFSRFYLWYTNEKNVVYDMFQHYVRERLGKDFSQLLVSFTSPWTQITSPHQILVVSFIVILLITPIFYATYVYTNVYKKHFAGKRLCRDEKNCPSYSKHDPPSIRSWKSYGEQRDQLESNYNLHPDLFTPASTSEKPTASELDMDHIHISFFQLLWAFVFVGPFSYLLWKKAIMWLQLRTYLVKIGVLEKKAVNYEEAVGKIVLEQSQVIHYVGRTKVTKTKQEANVAGFLFPDFPYVNIEGKFKVAKSLSVDINLESKRMVSCKMDGESLTASEALILLWYNTISAQHVKVHALGNWGVNVGSSYDSTDINPFFQRNSVVSVIYNYFGFTSFTSFMEEWKKVGLLSKDWDPQAFTDTFVHGLKENVCQHSHVTELMPHSDFVNFITKTRSIFHSEFVKHKHMFPGIHPEGLFAGTVLHSLDHELMEWNLEDPLWLDVDHPKFGKMAELGRIVRVGFVPEVPGYMFHRHFRGSGHPFYETVYAKASKVNKKMADSMETCICR